MDGTPFYFDENIFDDDTLSKITEEERAALPEFTREEVENEKKKSYQAGLEAGKKSALDDIHHKTLVVLEKVQRDISVLFASEDDRYNKYETDAVLLSLTIVRKLFPDLIKKHGLQEVEAGLSKVILEYKTPDQIAISLHPDTHFRLKSYIEKAEEQFRKSINVIADSNIDIHACKISWPDGGITLRHSEIAEKTFSLITESLAEEGVSVHDGVESLDNSDAEENNNQVGVPPHE